MTGLGKGAGSHGHFCHCGRPGVEANHDGKKHPHYRKKGKRGWRHVAHLRRRAKKDKRKAERAETKHIITKERDA